MPSGRSTPCSVIRQRHNRRSIGHVAALYGAMLRRGGPGLDACANTPGRTAA